MEEGEGRGNEGGMGGDGGMGWGGVDADLGWGYGVVDLADVGREDGGGEIEAWGRRWDRGGSGMVAGRYEDLSDRRLCLVSRCEGGGCFVVMWDCERHGIHGILPLGICIPVT